MTDPGGPAVVVPEIVRAKAAALGAEGAAWLAGLPGILDRLGRQWSITVGAAIEGGTAAYVTHARTDAGRDVVLKVAVPDPSFRDRVGLLERAHGRGYVRLLTSDLERHAMLLERLGSSLEQIGAPPEAQLESLCRMLRDAWRVPRVAGATVAPEHEKAASLARLIRTLWHELDRPCPEPVVLKALRYAARRAAAFDLDCCVVVHGDPHPGNALRVRSPRPGAEAGFVFVDPDGFLADPAYDLGVVLRDWSSQLLATAEPGALARRYCLLLADRTGIDARAVWEWGYLERVSSGLFAMSFGADLLGRRFLASADLLV